jgi:hypothetical protein
MPNELLTREDLECPDHGPGLALSPDQDSPGWDTRWDCPADGCGYGAAS